MAHCAQSGIELIGVSSPLISTHRSTTNNIRNILCDIFDEKLAIMIPMPDITNINNNAAIYIASRDPVGERP